MKSACKHIEFSTAPYELVDFMYKTTKANKLWFDDSNQASVSGQHEISASRIAMMTKFCFRFNLRGNQCTWSTTQKRGLNDFPAHKGQWRGALMFSLICAWINGWVNNGEAGDVRRHRAHYDVIITYYQFLEDSCGPLTPIWFRSLHCQSDNHTSSSGIILNDRVQTDLY